MTWPSCKLGHVISWQQKLISRIKDDDVMRLKCTGYCVEKQMLSCNIGRQYPNPNPKLRAVATGRSFAILIGVIGLQEHISAPPRCASAACRRGHQPGWHSCLPSCSPALPAFVPEKSSYHRGGWQISWMVVREAPHKSILHWTAPERTTQDGNSGLAQTGPPSCHAAMATGPRLDGFSLAALPS